MFAMTIIKGIASRVDIVWRPKIKSACADGVKNFRLHWKKIRQKVLASVLANSRHPFSGQTFSVEAAYNIPV